MAGLILPSLPAGSLHGMTLRIGSRTTPLSLYQTRQAERLLIAQGARTEIRTYKTAGDKIQSPFPLATQGGKGLFLKEIEEALLRGEIDLAVHALKDVPSQALPEFAFPCFLPRGPVEDVVLTREGKKLEDLDPESVIGTSAPRRMAQLKENFPYLRVAPLRGSIETRLKKLEGRYEEAHPACEERDFAFDGILLARASLDRLGLSDRITQILDPAVFVPPPGQGTIVLECLAERKDLITALTPLSDPQTTHISLIERSLARALQATCTTPLGIWAESLSSSEENVLSCEDRLCQDVPHSLQVSQEDHQEVFKTMSLRLSLFYAPHPDRPAIRHQAFWHPCQESREAFSSHLAAYLQKTCHERLHLETSHTPQSETRCASSS